MKNFLLFFFICFAIQSVGAQSLTLSPDTAHAKFDPIFMDLKATLEVCNTTGKEISFYWKFEQTMGPFYEPFLCDLNACYGPDKTECPATDPNVLMAGQCYPLDLHLNSEGVFECGKFIFTVWVVGDTTDNASATNAFKCTTSADDEILEAMSVYPNPASTLFHISNGDIVDGVEVVNMLGSPVKSYLKPRTNAFDISDLRKGIYFVRLKDDNGNVLKSIRLYKQ